MEQKKLNVVEKDPKPSSLDHVIAWMAAEGLDQVTTRKVKSGYTVHTTIEENESLVDEEASE